MFYVSEINQSPRKIQLAKFLSWRSYFKKLWNVARGRVKFLDWTLKTCCESGHIPMNAEWSAHKDPSKTNWLLKERSSVTKAPMNSFVGILVALLVVETYCDQVFWETKGDIYESKYNRHRCQHHSFYVRKKTVDRFFCISNDDRFRLKWAVSLKNAKYRWWQQHIRKKENPIYWGKRESKGRKFRLILCHWAVYSRFVQVSGRSCSKPD